VLRTDAGAVAPAGLEPEPGDGAMATALSSETTMHEQGRSAAGGEALRDTGALRYGTSWKKPDFENTFRKGPGSSRMSLGFPVGRMLSG